jgi:predicted nucleic acid-binding protein
VSRVLVDTSIWIDFFRGNPVAEPLIELLDNGNVVTNDLILTELLPSIRKRKEEHLEEMLLSIERVPMAIDWNDLAEIQLANLVSGNNNMGIPDLMIFQNAVQNNLVLYENDRHFIIVGKKYGLSLLRKEETSLGK